MLGGHDSLSTNNYLPIGYTVITYKVDGSGNNSMSFVTLMQMDFLFLPCHRMAYSILRIICKSGIRLINSTNTE